MKVALIHEWLVTLAGAESVLKSIYSSFPGHIYTLFHDERGVEKSVWNRGDIHPSFLQKIPFARRHHRAFLPLFPLAVEQFDLRDYNLIISSSYAVGKGVLTSSDQLHICYCHSPMRYIWDLTFEYLETSGLTHGIKSFLARLVFHYMRLWDTVSASRVNEFVANSHYIANRIKKCYNRTASVIYPPVDVDLFSICDKREKYFVTISRLVPYKRLDVMIRAFNRLKLPLLIIGDGPCKNELKRIARKNITFCGHLPFDRLRDTLQQARAFVFCAEEDFGIVNVEAQACGVPVIAFGRGGALETVVAQKTGVFFYRQDPRDLIDAVTRFLALEERFDPQTIRANAEQFPRSRFEREFSLFVQSTWDRFPYKNR